MDIEQYLNRINILKMSSHTPSFLKELQQKHVENVAWENLDLFYLKKISLDSQYLFKKIVQYRQGGICFELNYLYYQLLCQLGFKAKLIPARIFSLNDKKYTIPRDTHIVILVEIENHRFLTDISWNGFRSPISLANGEIEDITGKHRIMTDTAGNLTLQKQFGENWITQYQFFDREIQKSDILPHLDYRNASQEREVAHHLIFVQHTSNGLISLWDDKVTILENNKKQEFSIESLGGLPRVFMDLFKLSNIERYFELTV